MLREPPHPLPYQFSCISIAVHGSVLAYTCSAVSVPLPACLACGAMVQRGVTVLDP